MMLLGPEWGVCRRPDSQSRVDQEKGMVTLWVTRPTHGESQ